LQETGSADVKCWCEGSGVASPKFLGWPNVSEQQHLFGIPLLKAQNDKMCQKFEGGMAPLPPWLRLCM